MKKFNFQLEPVLSYRKNVEEKERQLLAAMAGFLESERARLQDLRGKYEQAQQELAAKESAHFDRSESGIYRAYLKRLSGVIRSKAEQIAKLQAQVEKQTAQVVAAYKSRKILELMRAKKYEEFCRTRDIQEQQFVDDLQVAKYANERIP
jgi:flagellar FliJ protein